jgi:hypothetical protein
VWGGWVNGYIQIYEDPQYLPNFWEKKFIDNQRVTGIIKKHMYKALIVNKLFSH